MARGPRTPETVRKLCLSVQRQKNKNTKREKKKGQKENKLKDKKTRSPETARK